MNATDKRVTALVTINNAVVTTERVDGEYMNVWHFTDRATVAGMIRSLSTLGRTARWAKAIETWAVMVENEANPYEWAFIQGGVYAAHAAN